MKRRSLWPDHLPERLRAFSPEDWPASDVWDGFALWKAARDCFQDEHGWPSGPVERVIEDRRARLALIARLGTNPPRPG